MKFPCLVPKKICKTPIHIEINTESVGENGEPVKVLIFDTMCNFQDKAKRVLTAKQQLIQIEGVAIIPGDVAPNMASLSDGTVIVNGIVRSLYRGEKARNLDGTVNYTRLELK